jgi:lysophospholipase L1-like esterase
MMRVALVFGLLCAVLVVIEGGDKAADAADPPTIVAFGDSIAAGEGSGDSAGYPNNPAAYSARLAAELGGEAFNFAVSGACVATAESGHPSTPASCVSEKSILTRQLADADRFEAAYGALRPDIVTVTIGANDIQFAGCLQALLAGEFGVQVEDDPCSPESLGAHLEALGSNLDAALQQIERRYPFAKVAVTSYFNPMPSKVIEGGEPPCDAMRYLYPAQRYRAKGVDGLAGVLTDIVRGRLDEKASEYQNKMFSRAERVVKPLSRTLQKTVKQRSATFVPLDFTGHDFCQDYQDGNPDAWVFAPLVEGSLALGVTSLDATFVPTTRCVPQLPAPGCNVRAPIVIAETVAEKKILGTSYVLSYQLFALLNDFPHLTPAGQAFVGQEIRTALTPLSYSGGRWEVAATVGQPISTFQALAGGALPYKARLQPAGSTPSWLVAKIFGRQVRLSGTPNEAGTYDFAVVVTDARGDSVAIPVTLHVTDPATPQRWTHSVENTGSMSSWLAPDGSTWVWHWNRDLVRLDAGGVETSRRPLPMQPFSMTFGPAGRAYVVGQPDDEPNGPTALLYAIDRTGVTIATRELQWDRFRYGTVAVAYAPDGRLFVQVHQLLRVVDPDDLSTLSEYGVDDSFTGSRGTIEAASDGLRYTYPAEARARFRPYSDLSSSQLYEPSGPYDFAPSIGWSPDGGVLITVRSDRFSSSCDGLRSTRFAPDGSVLYEFEWSARFPQTYCEVFGAEASGSGASVLSLLDEAGVPTLVWLGAAGQELARAAADTPAGWYSTTQGDLAVDANGRAILSYTVAKRCADYGEVTDFYYEYFCEKVLVRAFDFGQQVASTEFEGDGELGSEMRFVRMTASTSLNWRTIQVGNGVVVLWTRYGPQGCGFSFCGPTGPIAYDAVPFPVARG